MASEQYQSIATEPGFVTPKPNRSNSLKNWLPKAAGPQSIPHPLSRLNLAKHVGLVAGWGHTHSLRGCGSTIWRSKAFTFYLLFFTLGAPDSAWECEPLVVDRLFCHLLGSVLEQVLNIITGVFVENASVLFKPDDREVGYFEDCISVQIQDRFWGIAGVYATSSRGHWTGLSCNALKETAFELVTCNSFDGSTVHKTRHLLLEVTAILEAMDVDGSGILSTRQVIDAMQDDMFEHALHTIGIDIRMPEHYFNTLSSVTGQEELSIDEFVAHIVQMKGSVSRPDLQTLTLETALLQKLGIPGYFLDRPKPSWVFCVLLAKERGAQTGIRIASSPFTHSTVSWNVLEFFPYQWFYHAEYICFLG